MNKRWSGRNFKFNKRLVKNGQLFFLLIELSSGSTIAIYYCTFLDEKKALKE